MPDGAHHEDWHPRHSPWLVAVGVMLATFMQVLDTSIANIALPHIAGSLSASTDQATWVLTSYLVANAIILPMTGWLGNHFGRKRVLISCIGIFVFASVLCGMAVNLPMLIAARILQGAGSGAQFSLLPPENATGNYVKVVQRVPVKILFDEPLPADKTIGPGLSVAPSVQTGSFRVPDFVTAIVAIILAFAAAIIFRFVLNRKKESGLRLISFNSAFLTADHLDK